VHGAGHGGDGVLGGEGAREWARNVGDVKAVLTRVMAQQEGDRGMRATSSSSQHRGGGR
jgi:hypothetical protein